MVTLVLINVRNGSARIANLIMFQSPGIVAEKMIRVSSCIGVYARGQNLLRMGIRMEALLNVFQSEPLLVLNDRLWWTYTRASFFVIITK